MGKGRGKGKHGVGVDSMPTPPDGGWGWFVVLGSFLLHVVADGIVYSFGVFYMEFLTYFKGGKGETAWVGSLVPGVTFLVGKSKIYYHPDGFTDFTDIMIMIICFSV